MSNPSTIIPVKRFNSLLIGQGITTALVKWMQQNSNITQIYPDIAILDGYHDNYQSTFPACIMVYPSGIGDMDNRFWRGKAIVHVRIAQGNMYNTKNNLLIDSATIIMSEFRFDSQFIYDLRADVPGLAKIEHSLKTSKLTQLAQAKDNPEYMIEINYAIRIREYERFILRQHSATAAVLKNNQYKPMETTTVIMKDENEIIIKEFQNK